MATPDKSLARGKWVFRGALTAAAFAVAATIILDPAYDANTKSWAGGTIGFVLGYWLR